MYRTTRILIGALLLCTGSAWGIVVVEDGPFTLGTDWNYNSVDGTITIFTASTSDTYVFWAHEDGQPTVLAQIREIKRDVTLTSGTVKVQVSKSGGPGATTVGDISFDTANITSIIEGISVTGDFLTTAITVDHITGPIEVGGSLTAGMTVNEDLEGAVTILNSIESGADVEVIGDVYEPISVGVYVPNRDEDSYNDVSAVAAPITINGNLVAPMYIYGDLDAPLHIFGDMIGGPFGFRGDTVPLGLWLFGDMNADVTIEGEKHADLAIEGDLATGTKLHVKGTSLRHIVVGDCFNYEDHEPCTSETRGLHGTVEIGTEEQPADLGAEGTFGTVYNSGYIFPSGVVRVHGDAIGCFNECYLLGINNTIISAGWSHHGLIDVSGNLEGAEFRFHQSGYAHNDGPDPVQPENGYHSDGVARVGGTMSDYARIIYWVGDFETPGEIEVNYNDNPIGIELGNIQIVKDDLFFPPISEHTGSITVHGDIAEHPGTIPVIVYGYWDGVLEITGNVVGGLTSSAPIVLRNDLKGEIVIDGNVESMNCGSPGCNRISLSHGIDGGSIRVKKATVANAGDDDSAVLSMVLETFVEDENDPPQLIRILAEDPATGGAAHEDFEFDVTILGGGLIVVLVNNNEDIQPADELFDLSILATSPSGIITPYTKFSDLAIIRGQDTSGSADAVQMRNLRVDGDIGDGVDWDTYAVQVGKTDVGAIRTGGELRAKLYVNSIQLLAYDELDANLCIPQNIDPPYIYPWDGCTSGATPAVTTLDDTNGFVQTSLAFDECDFEGLHYWYVNTSNDDGFDREQWLESNPNCLGPIVFYPASSNSLWECAKGKVSDIDSSGGVDMYDFVSFALCFAGEDVTTPPTGCSADHFDRADFDQDGDVDLDDFAVFAKQLEPQAWWDDLPESCTPTYTADPDASIIEDFVDMYLEDLGLEDPFWADLIDDLLDILDGYDDPDYDDLVTALVAVNFKPVAEDKSYSVTKNTPKIMSLGNASDPDGDTLIKDLVTVDPSHGSIGWTTYDFYGNLVSFQYIPDIDYTGEDTLTWRATEVGTTQEYYAEAVITITVAE